MDKEEIIRMAREAGLVRTGDKWVEPARWGITEIERFAALVAAHEREACASICFQEGPSIDGELIAEAIRARGEK